MHFGIMGVPWPPLDKIISSICLPVRSALSLMDAPFSMHSEDFSDEAVSNVDAVAYYYYYVWDKC